MKSGKFGQIVDKHNPIQRMTPPQMHVGLNPNLLANPPIIGLNTNDIPLNSEPAQDIVA